MEISKETSRIDWIMLTYFNCIQMNKRVFSFRQLLKLFRRASYMFKNNLSEVKHDVNGTETAKGKDNFWFWVLFFQSVNKAHKNGITYPTIHCQCKQFHSTVFTTDETQQKFYFCRLPFDVNVMLNLYFINDQYNTAPPSP